MLGQLLVPIIISVSSVAAVEPWTVAIQEAQKLALAKNRKAATAKLIEAIKIEKPASRARARLLESLKNISEMFFSDKGQRLYETGQSSYFESADTALLRYKEALDVEDSNLTVLTAMARAQLSKKDCASADATLKIAAQINPYSEAVHLLEGKTLLCQNLPKDAIAVLRADPSDDPVTSVTLASALWQNGSVRESVALLQRTLGKDGAFPEVHYWLWKASEAQAEVAEQHGGKYVALCKNLALKTRQKYLKEPRLCGQTQEVEDAIKNSQKSSEH
jgi:predicted Zn-dependent protease